MRGSDWKVEGPRTRALRLSVLLYGLADLAGVALVVGCLRLPHLGDDS